MDDMERPEVITEEPEEPEEDVLVCPHMEPGERRWERHWVTEENGKTTKHCSIKIKKIRARCLKEHCACYVDNHCTKK